MKVRFLQTVTVKAVNGETFEKGKEYDLAVPSARHWINRNIAVSVENETATREPDEKAVKPKGRKRKADDGADTDDTAGQETGDA